MINIKQKSQSRFSGFNNKTKKNSKKIDINKIKRFGHIKYIKIFYEFTLDNNWVDFICIGKMS